MLNLKKMKGKYLPQRPYGLQPLFNSFCSLFCRVSGTNLRTPHHFEVFIPEILLRPMRPHQDHFAPPLFQLPFLPETNDPLGKLDVVAGTRFYLI